MIVITLGTIWSISHFLAKKKKTFTGMKFLLNRLILHSNVYNHFNRKKLLRKVDS
jgi:hypothetical protein